MDFEELDKCLRSSQELSPLSGLLPSLPVQPVCEEHSSYLAEFLERLLLCVDDYLWSCPPILSFLDDSQGKGGFKDVHIAILEKKVDANSVPAPCLVLKSHLVIRQAVAFLNTIPSSTPSPIKIP